MESYQTRTTSFQTFCFRLALERQKQGISAFIRLNFSCPLRPEKEKDDEQRLSAWSDYISCAFFSPGKCQTKTNSSNDVKITESKLLEHVFYQNKDVALIFLPCLCRMNATFSDPWICRFHHKAQYMYVSEIEAFKGLEKFFFRKILFFNIDFVPDETKTRPEKNVLFFVALSRLALLGGCLHDTGGTFAPERVHSGSLSWLYICLHDTTTKCYAGASHPGVSSPRFSHRARISLRYEISVCR